jgi:hypothetical protein
MVTQPLDDLHAAVQTFSNHLADDSTETGVVTQALIAWEEVTFDDDGTPRYTVLYAATGEANPSRSVGLAYHLLKTLQRDLIGCDCGE